MADLFSLVEFYKNQGFSPLEAVNRAENERDKDRSLEFEKIKLERSKLAYASQEKGIFIFVSVAQHQQSMTKRILCFPMNTS